MKPWLAEHSWLLAFVLGLAVLGIGCSSGGDDEQGREDATETNFAPPPCGSDEECPNGCRCARSEDGEEPGLCEQLDGDPSSPAPCESGGG